MCVLDTGHEFNDADTLTTSEAKLLIDAVLTQRPKDTGEEMALTEYVPLRVKARVVTILE